MSKVPATFSLRQSGFLTGWCAFIFSICWGVLPFCVQAQAPVEELRTAAAVRALTAEQAPKQMPVRLRGVVTFFNEKLYSRFIQDETAGIYLQASTNTPLLFPGQLVEVAGVTSP